MNEDFREEAKYSQKLQRKKIKRIAIASLICLIMLIGAFITDKEPDNPAGSKTKTSQSATDTEEEINSGGTLGDWMFDVLNGDNDSLDNPIEQETGDDEEKETAEHNYTYSEGSEEIPVYAGEPYVELNGNVPEFTVSDMTTTSFESYSELDSLGRCGTAYACIGADLMPDTDRESISTVKPSGWNNKQYDSDLVDGGWIYNRCHLIAFCLTGENANSQNLITGTRSFNVDGMLPFEVETAEYVESTGNHVLYRVTPIYDGDDLVARGVQMEGYSIEDSGDSICFNVFVFNIQPGITIDYATGENWLA